MWNIWITEFMRYARSDLTKAFAGTVWWSRPHSPCQIIRNHRHIGDLLLSILVQVIYCYGGRETAVIVGGVYDVIHNIAHDTFYNVQCIRNISRLVSLHFFFFFARFTIRKKNFFEYQKSISCFYFQI